MTNGNYILGIESSCDDTSAAIVCGNRVLSNVIANQKVHEQYGGVVPELASRAHQANIVPVVHEALKQAGISKEQLKAVAYTRGPGLLGSLLVGSCFAKSFAQALQIPSIEVNHMQAHVIANFAGRTEPLPTPLLPMLCLTVSGGHTQLVKVDEMMDMQVIGETADDAAGEAFDKIAKFMGLPFPGGPLIDKHAKNGNIHRYNFSKTIMPGYDFSFSGFKTNVTNFINQQRAHQPNFVEENVDDLCASVQHAIVEMLLEKVSKAAIELGYTSVAIAGGVSANSYLRSRMQELSAAKKWNLYIPAFEFCTDNAAMIAVAGNYKFEKKCFASLAESAVARYTF